MPTGYDDWGARNDKAKTAKIERSLAQDVGRKTKKEVIGTEYPEKIVNKIDIGEICNFWAYTVIVMLDDNEPKIIDRLNTMIQIAFKHGYNLNNYMPFQTIMKRDGNRLIQKKFNGMKTIPKLSFMGNLDKPKKKSSGYGNVRW